MLRAVFFLSPAAFKPPDHLLHQEIRMVHTALRGNNRTVSPSSLVLKKSSLYNIKTPNFIQQNFSLMLAEAAKWAVRAGGHNQPLSTRSALLRRNLFLEQARLGRCEQKASLFSHESPYKPAVMSCSSVCLYEIYSFSSPFQVTNTLKSNHCHYFLKSPFLGINKVHPVIHLGSSKMNLIQGSSCLSKLQTSIH